MEALAWDRRFLQLTAAGLLDETRFIRAMRAIPAYDIPSKYLLVSLRAWARHGAQSVQMPHTFASALAASSVCDALKGSELPWDSFEIQVPSGLVPTQQGDVTSVFVLRAPRSDTDLKIETGYDIWMVYTAGPSTCYAQFQSIAELSDADSEDLFDDFAYTDQSGTEVEKAKAYELRIWHVLRRIAAGVMLSIEQARHESVGAYASRPQRIKRDSIRANTFVLGKPLKLDCASVVRGFILGKRGPATVCTIVRGHWVRQPHGPERALRKVIWRKPHPRGHGPMLVRPVRLEAGRGHT